MNKVKASGMSAVHPAADLRDAPDPVWSLRGGWFFSFFGDSTELSPHAAA
jgi:hypothetical protein